MHASMKSFMSASDVATRKILPEFTLSISAHRFITFSFIRMASVGETNSSENSFSSFILFTSTSMRLFMRLIRVV